MIKAVIFDIDNTLYGFDKANAAGIAAVAEYACRELNISAEDFSALHKKTQERLNQRMGKVAATHNRLIRYQNMLEELHLPLSPHVLKMEALFWDTLLEKAELTEGAEELFRTIKRMGILIGIGTNMTARMQFRKLEKLGLLPYTDFVLTSEEAGMEKPDPLFYEFCAEKAGCASGECLFIGDSYSHDARGAVRSGMKALWYCPDDRVPDSAGPFRMEEGICRIQKLAQAADYLEASQRESRL